MNRLHTVTVATLLTLVAGLAPLAPMAAAAPDPAAAEVATFTTDPTLPVQVTPPRSGTPASVFVSLRADRAAPDLTVRAAGEDLQVTDASRALGSAEPGDSFGVSFPVSATSTGLHTLTVTATSSDGGSSVLELPYVWRAGGPLPASGASLAGKAWARNDDVVGDGGSGSRSANLLTFVDGTRATFGPAPITGQECRCRRYSYDPTTGIVQLAGGIIGQVRSNYFSGIVSTLEEEPFEGLVFDRVAQPRPGTHLAGRWSFTSRYGDDGLYSQTLRLTRGGAYNLSYGYFLDHRYGSRKLAGRYEIGKAGRLVLRGRHGPAVLQVARLAVVISPDGTARPGSGVRLTQTIRAGKPARTYTDGNLLPARR